MEETETVLTLTDFGALLRERRIHKELTEENVTAGLKITSRLVKAIEEGDMESMPHAVYARGFIQAYVKLLTVDDGVTHAACTLLRGPEEELCEQETRVVSAATRREGSHVPQLAILLCALFLAGGAWYFRDSIPGLSSSTVSREKTASSAVSSPAVPEADTVVTTPAIPAEPVANATLPATSEGPTVLGRTPLPAETEIPTEQAALPTTSYRMLPTAQDGCWISTTTDGKNSQHVTHRRDTLNIDFQEKLVMKLGNTGAVLITCDGKELPPAGEIGQVKIVMFPNDAQNQSMEWSGTAFVSEVRRFREPDLWLRMLTRRHGIISAFAFGGSRSRKRFCGCLDLFNELQISTKTTRNGMYLSLQEGNLIRGLRRLRTSWNRLGMFMNCVRFVEVLGIPQDGTAGVFPLLKDTLELLERPETVQDILPILFRLRLASQQGYAPTLTAYVSCGKKDFSHAGFLVSEGTIVCPDCVSGRGNIVEINGKSLDVLRQVQEVSPLHWHFLTSGSSEEADGVLLPAERRECARAVDGFVQYHLGLTWDRGCFRRV